jgi:hypothetical protein
LARTVSEEGAARSGGGAESVWVWASIAPIAAGTEPSDDVPIEVMFLVVEEGFGGWGRLVLDLLSGRISSSHKQPVT